MKKDKKGLPNRLGLFAFVLISVISAITLVIGLGTKVFKTNTTDRSNFGDEASVPGHEKSLVDNGDGTYKINLNVTGDSETKPVKANVVIIMDMSNSMKNNAVSGTTRSLYTYDASTYSIDNLYFRHATNTGDSYRVYYNTANNRWYRNYNATTNTYSTEYSGNVYWQPNRISEERNALATLVPELLSNNTPGDPIASDIIEVSVVGYNLRSFPIISKSTDDAAIENAVFNVHTSEGTNWEEGIKEGLKEAAAYKEAEPDQKVYIIFMTDGEPTARSETLTWDNPIYTTPSNGDHHEDDAFWKHWSAAADDARAAAEINNSSDGLYTIFTYGTNNTYINYLNNLTYYAYGQDGFTNANFGNSNPTNGRFYNATNTAALAASFKTIAEQINTSGIGAAVIEDGTTAAVEVSSGEVSGGLIDVDANSFKYYLSFKLKEDGTSDSEYIKTIELIDEAQNLYKIVNSKDEEYTVKRVPAYNIDEHGMEKTTPENEKTDVFKFEWQTNTPNPLYPDTNPPAATYDGNPESTKYGEVDWSLKSLGVLLNDITYTVSYDCWPSQAALDLVADIKNNPDKYDDLSAPANQYIDRDGNILTNTTAVVKYQDTRVSTDEETVSYTNPDSIETAAVERLAVSKVWIGAQGDKSITLYVDRDSEKEKYEVPLVQEANTNINKGSIYTSIGILVEDSEGHVTLKTEGHDFAFSERQELSYRWELNAPITHPMMINGVITNLILVEDEEELSTVESMTTDHETIGEKEYYRLPLKDGTKYYYVDEKDSEATLTAENILKNILDIQKVVEGEDADPDQLFTFNVVMDTNNVKETEVWFSIWDNTHEALLINNDEGTYVNTAILETKEDGKEGYEYVGYTASTGILTYKKDGKTNTVYVGKNYTVDTTAFPTGYYYTANPANVNLSVKAGWNIRFINVPTESTYTITETDDGGEFYRLKDVEATIDGADKDDFENKADSKISGTVTDGNTSHKAVFTNEYLLTHLDVEKEWVDNDNQDVIRPESITVNVMNGNEKVTSTTITPDEDGNWHHTFENLPKFDDKGNDIIYTVIEEPITVPSGFTGYTVDYEDLNAKDEETSNEGTTEEESEDEEPPAEGFSYKIINTHIPETTTSTIVKDWQDDGNRDGLRPTSITMTLKDSEGNTITFKDAEENDTTTVTLTAENDWTESATNLPKYKNVNDERVTIVYTWTEPTVTGYTASDPVVSGNTVTITNTHEIATKSATVTKTWDDDSNRDGVRPTSIVMTLYDDKDQVVTFKDATGASTSTVTLTEDNDWTETVSGLPANRKNTTTDESEPITYHWTEDTTKLPTGYSKSAEATTPSETNDSTRITNSYEYEKTSRKITKVWSDDDNRDGIRPTTLVVTLSNYGDVTLTAANGWTATISNLPVHRNNNGTIETIEYTWSEDENNLPEGYSLTGNTSTTTEAGIETIFTNSYTPETTYRKITKVWADDDNRDAIRPTTLVVTLSNYGDVTLTAANNWTATISNLPVHRNNEGQIETIDYTWSEDESKLPEGYRLTGNTDTPTETGIETTITNTHDIATKPTTVTKVWEDDSNRDGVRPTTIVMTLYDDKNQVVTFKDKNGNETSTVTLTGTGNSWTETVTGLPANRLNTTTGRAEEIHYHWTEDESSLPTGYSKKSENTEDDTTTIVNEYQYATTSRKITKEWLDNGNQDGVRPTTLVVTLSNYGDVTLTAATGWTATISNLPVHRNNDGVIEDIQYVWTENEDGLPEGYSLTKTEISEDRIETTLYNSYKPETTTSTIIKDWKDDGNRDGVRPTTLVVTLSNYGDVTLTAEDGWTATIENLPVHRNNDGKIETIEYKWSEKNVPTGYRLTNTTTSGTITTIENTHDIKLTSITATKDWKDNDNQDGLRLPSVTFELVANGERTGAYKDATAPNWTVTFDNLKENENGQPIQYTVREETVIPEYEAPVVTGTMAEGFVITNKHTPELTEVTFTKKWVDGDNHDGMRPETIPLTLKDDQGNVVDATPTITKDGNTWTIKYSGLPKYNGSRNPIVYTIEEGEVENYQGKVDGDTITNTHTPETVNITVAKQWYDNSNQDGARPGTITLTLYADGVEVETAAFSGEGNVWYHTFEGLDKYKNVGGKPHEIVYTVDEKDEDVPEGYEKTKDGLTIKNTHNIATTEVTGTKIWDDDDDRDGIRPDSVTVKLLANGSEALHSDGKTKVQPITVNEDNNWTYTFTDLPKYQSGAPITYTVAEEDVEGYNPEIIVENDKINIKNTHEIEKVEISGTKVWDDADDQDGKRPTSITIKLMVGETEIQSTTATAEGGWTWSFENLPKNENGVAIEYSIVEVQVDEYDEPKVEKVPETDYEYTVTNTHTPETVTFTINKDWRDDDDRDGIRPESIVINILADGKPAHYNDGKLVPEQVITDVDNWSITIENLPKYSKGKPITYSFTEVVVEGYETEIVTNEENPTSITIVNTHTPETTEIEITKTWEEDQFYLDRRPDMITVDIYADGVYLDTIKVYKNEDWTAKITDLYKYNNGVKIEYTIKEQLVDGYVSQVSGSQESGYKITNTFVDGEGCTDCDEPPHTRIDITFDNSKDYYAFTTLLLGAVALSSVKKYEM